MDHFKGSMLCLLLMALASGITGKKQKQPNILFIMSDDTGRADYETIDPTMRTPTLTILEERGIVMNQSYTLQTCTPTRSALLTGRYPYKMGLQLGKIKGTALRWLDVHQKLLPASLKELNYTTHAVGKWHLGFCNKSLLPTRRGFDTFYGFYGGAQGYFNHSGGGNGSYDFRDNETVAWDAEGMYSTELFTQRVQSIIRQQTTPFYIYLAYQNSHAPFEVKQSYVTKYCSHVRDETRRLHCAMVAAMDEGIGNITRTLCEMGLEDNTIIVYLSDNGGVMKEGSYNWPLRGGKSSLWEGGTRSRAIFVYPAGMNCSLKGTTWEGLFHVTDWYPTLYSAAGGNTCDLQEMDGINQLAPLLTGGPGVRTDMIYNIDPTQKRAAVRIGDYKYINGEAGKNALSNSGPAPPGMNVTSTPLKTDIPNEQLYNVRVDPTESHDLMNQTKTNCTLKKTLRDLRDLLAKEQWKVIPFPDNVLVNKSGRPTNYGGVWSPGWCDPYTQDHTGAAVRKKTFYNFFS